MSRTNDWESENINLKNYVKISMIVHVGIFLALTIKATFFTDPPLVLENAIRVDMVGLPDKIKEAPAPPAPAPAPAAPPKQVEMPKKEVTPPPVVAKPEPVKPQPKVKEPDAINLSKTKSKEKLAMEKLKQMAALEAIQKDLDAENKKKAAAKAASQEKYKGNVLASGTELTGINKLQADNYTGEVLRHMKNHWEIPQYIKNNSLSTMVLVRFDEGGIILSKSIVKSSGNPAFDEIVLTAIQNSSPVPPPPPKFAKIASVEGFLFRFSPDQ
jgi:colicin import membrane protein